MTEEFECPECDDYSGTKYGLIGHFGNKHPESDIEDPTDSYTEFECDECGETEERLKKHLGRVDGQYCSVECSGKSQEKKESFVCDGCGEHFEKCPSLRKEERTYCSQECYSNDNSKTVECNLDSCDNKMRLPNTKIEQYDNNYCSVDCQHESMEKSLDESEATHFSRTPAGIAWRDAIRERDNWTCEDCGSRNNIEAHHIKRRADCEINQDGIDERLAMWNGVSLCRFCHAMRHEGEQVFELMKSRVENFDERLNT